MQSNRIMAGLAAGAVLLGSGEAMALAPDTPPDIEIYASGATAQDTNVEKLFSELCKPGTLDVYYDNLNSAKPGAAHRALFCTLDGTKVTGLDNSSPKVLFHKRSAGGSGMGVNNVIANQPISAMVVNSTNCTRDAAETKLVEGQPIYRCGAAEGTPSIISVASDVGVSDVNPGLFRGLNTPSGQKDVVIADVARKLDVQSGGALVFGTPVTKSLRDALQRAQIDQGRLDAGCEGSEEADCMPSLSRYQIASLFTGNVGKWSNFVVVGQDGTSSRKLTDYAKAGEIADDKVYLCRRVRGSGTQTQFNAKFLNYPCAGSAGAAPTEVVNKLAGPITILNSGSGDVNLCLDDFNNGTNNGKTNTASIKAWAIGVQSTENNAKLDFGYRFIKIDGVAPTLQEAAAGRYMDFAEVTWQWLKAGQKGAPTGDKLKIIQKVARDAGKPSILGGIDAAFKHSFGNGGYLALTSSGNAAPANGILDLNNPVSAYTHAPGKVVLDNCRVPLVDPGKVSPL